MASARSVAQAPHPRPSRSLGALLEPALVPASPAECDTHTHCASASDTAVKQSADSLQDGVSASAPVCHVLPP